MEEFKHVCKKVAFSDEKQALFYIDKLIKTSSREIIPVRAYLCEFCIGWHLTSIRDLTSDTIQKKLDNCRLELTELHKTILELEAKNENQKKALFLQIKAINSLKDEIKVYRQMYNIKDRKFYE